MGRVPPASTLSLTSQTAMPDTIRWGILGTGYIATVVARDFAHAEGAEIAAIGSRKQSTADAFGDEFGVPRRYDSYEAVARDPSVDIVFVGTPHPFHAEDALLCLKHGKPVLLEKPFTLNAGEAREVVAAARERDLFLMEAMWTRYLPAVRRARELVADGVIGELRMITASLAFNKPFDVSSRLFDPDLGGGALLDVGVYPLSLASMFWGAPDRIASMAHLGESGVDELASFSLGYDGGRIASLYTGLRVHSPADAVLMGTQGRIHLHGPLYAPKGLTLTTDEGEEQVMEHPVDGMGYQFEIEEVGRCLRAGERESPAMPLDETVALMETMDAIRAQWGLQYPGEA